MSEPDATPKNPTEMQGPKFLDYELPDHTNRGGEYFFMPSLSALRWIGSLAETNPTEQKER